MKSIQFSSGDLLADRRADYAEMLFGAGDMAAAAGLLRDALGLAPRWVAGWVRLGEMLEAAGDPAAAAETWREALRLDPSDRFGAMLRLSLVEPSDAIHAPPSLFVETLFDQYAEKFEVSLVEKLGYCVPQLLFEQINAVGRRQFAHALDLGCGTGLMGERLRGAVSHLEGVDLSAAMLRKARAKRIYDRLERADLTAMKLTGEKPDLITAADVFLYIGALDGIFARVAAMLSPGGIFAFSVERHDGPEAMALRATRRYAHSQAYLRELLARNGFEILSLTNATIRQDADGPIEGLLVVVQSSMAVAKIPAPLADAHEVDVLALH